MHFAMRESSGPGGDQESPRCLASSQLGVLPVFSVTAVSCLRVLEAIQPLVDSDDEIQSRSWRRGV